MGPEAEAVVAAPLDPLGDLVAALTDLRNWSAQLPEGPGVGTLREFQSPAVLAHPLGRLGMRQRVVPLEVTIDVYGGAPVPDDGHRFDLAFTLGGSPADQSRVVVRDDLPPGLFFNLTEDQKLSRPAFESLACGYTTIGAPQMRSGPGVVGADGYETRVVDEPDRPTRAVADAYAIPDAVGGILTGTGARARAGTFRYSGPDLGIAVGKPTYRLASTTDMRASGAPYPSYVEAAQAAQTAAGSVQVVGAHEVAP